MVTKTNEHDPLPTWLYPYNKNPNLTKMTEGDGRNDKLFTYILKLQSQGMAKTILKRPFPLLIIIFWKSLLNKMN